MPYSPTTWQDGVTGGNHVTMNNLETQYNEAMNSFNKDLFTAFIYNGFVATKDGTIASQLDVTGGSAYIKQSDSSLRNRAFGALNYTTSTPSTTYYLYLQPDGTWYWNTANSPAANSLAICQVTTDASANILAVTDVRNLSTTFLSSLTSMVLLSVTMKYVGGVGGSALSFTNPGSGSANGMWFRTWNGSAFTIPLSLGGQFQNALAWLGTLGDLHADNGLIASDGLGTFSGKAGSAAPGSNPTLALASGSTLGIGAYGYKVTYVSSLGESALSSGASITTTTGNQKVSLTVIPTGPTGTLKRNIYRTKVGGTAYFLLTTLNDNTTTTYTDTTADTSLVTAAPAHPSLGGDIWQNSVGTTVAQVFGDGAMYFDSGAITSDGAGNLTANSQAILNSNSNGGGAAGRVVWVGTTDPGSNAKEGDIWIDA